MNKAVIILAKRTPIGKKGGILKHIPPEKMAAEVMRNLVKESGIDPAEIDDVVLGNAVGPGGNLARLSALVAGFPMKVPGVTVDRQCGSGLEAINLAARLIQAGAGEVYLAGGVESSSRAPLKMETFHETGNPRIYERARFSPDDIGDPEMGVAAENVAQFYQISRAEQDNYAQRSYEKAVNSVTDGIYRNEIISIDGLSQDESPRINTNYNRLISRMQPAFKEEGTVTAGNSCGVNDGAAVVLLMSESKAKTLGLTPILTFVDAVATGVDPNLLGIGPVPAVKTLLKRNHLSIQDIDMVEFNEAFASQVIASLRELSIPWDKVNIGGGAIALGHPYGASGAILITRLCTEMVRSQAERGVATLGIGGGIGVASLFERYN